MTTTELFTQDGRLFCSLEEYIRGDVVTQIWRYAPDASAFAGAKPGSTEVAVFFTDAGVRHSTADVLIAAWTETMAREGLRSPNDTGEDGARAFLAQTNNRGTLWATDRAAA